MANLIASLSKSSNSDFDWNAFNSDEYFNRNYRKPHKSDLQILSLLCRFYLDIGKGAKVVDVGSGTNLYPALAASPYSEEVTLWEYSEANIRWLREELAKTELDPSWQKFGDHMKRDFKPYSDVDFVRFLSNHCSIRSGSIFDLPKKQWDVATMFFCAESITSNIGEFRSAMESFMACLVPGGSYFCSFMERSTGYEVDGVEFPAVSITKSEVEEVLAHYSTVCSVMHVGIQGHRLRKGYSGMLVGHGVVK